MSYEIQRFMLETVTPEGGENDHHLEGDPQGPAPRNLPRNPDAPAPRRLAAPPRHSRRRPAGIAQRRGPIFAGEIPGRPGGRGRTDEEHPRLLPEAAGNDARHCGERRITAPWRPSPEKAGEVPGRRTPPRLLQGPYFGSWGRGVPGAGPKQSHRRPFISAPAVCPWRRIKAGPAVPQNDWTSAC